jgi:hypothetical protein
MNVRRDIMRELSGSASNVNKDSEVKTLAVSSVSLPPLFRATTEKTANVRIGAATGVI